MLLLLEDDLELQAFLAQHLRQQGCELLLANSCADADRQLPGHRFDLYILDRMLPDGDGQDWLARRRAAGDNTPALFLTALGAVADKVDGLRLADDYLVKPFAFAELWARLQSILRRHRREPDTHCLVLNVGGLNIDRLTHRVHKGGQLIPLKPVEYKLLDCLITHSGQLVTRKMLLEQVWGFNFDPATNLVETYISRLRAHIDTPGAPSLIETLRGEGYRFAPL